MGDKEARSVVGLESRRLRLYFCVCDFNELFATLFGVNISNEQARPSLHRHTLRQIPRFIYVRPPRTRRVIRQQLQRHHVQDR